MTENLRRIFVMWTPAFDGEAGDVLWQDRERVSAVYGKEALTWLPSSIPEDGNHYNYRKEDGASSAL